MGIRHTSFKHGWFYHYRAHEDKSRLLCQENLRPLDSFIQKMFTNCPDHYFTVGPRSSALKFPIGCCPVKLNGHEVCTLAKASEHFGRYKTAHSNVEVYMLENDDKTIAVEVPIWLSPYELDIYKALFDSEDPLTGHIDILRIEDGKVWVWDYKPNAHKEKHAHCQVLFYCIMLSRRTGIPLEHFRAGYFDEKIAYVFKPEVEQLCPELMIEN